ncbi:MAG: B12-binding domain-containing protein [Granulosicoccus sp.]
MAKHSESSTVGAERQADLRPELKADGHACPETQQQQASVQPAPLQIELLLKTVETELIPRLFVSHMMDIPATSPLVENISSQPEPGPWCSEKAITAFAELCISNDPLKLDEHVTDLLARGIALESVFLYLLEPVARYLGVKWETDELSFLDVHLGLTRLHQLICECETIGFQSENVPLQNRSILLTCSPGDDHTFGLTMVADFFRRYGWRVSNLCGLDDEFVLSRLRSTRYSAVGFSLHHERSLDALRSLITQVRSVAINKEMIVMVGGNYFLEYPEAAAAVGADVFASNGKEAVLKANSACKISDRLSL